MRFVALLIASTLSCSPAAAETQTSNSDQGSVELEFAELATGSWSSEAQSRSETYDWVESETVRIMADRTDGVWLYQENAVIGASPDEVRQPSAKDAPYFQVVIQLRALGSSSVHTTTYRLETADVRAGARGIWRKPHRAFDPTWIGSVACMGVMHRVADGYWQGAAECPNGYKGGVRVDSRSVRTPDTYVNWDRGFDAEDRLVWGPGPGGYIFKRKDVLR
jgi:CpeT protein